MSGRQHASPGSRLGAEGAKADREHRRRAQERRERRNRLQMGFYVFCLVALLGGYWYANGQSSSSPVPLGADIRAPDGTPFLASDVGKDEQVLAGIDLRKNDRQRGLVEELARRHVGTVPQGTRQDLQILQQLVDERVLGRDQVFELQALGVVLGDLMVAELGLEWVVVNDRFGRSRALRYGKLDDYFFPVTMISKRYEKSIVVDVDQLYADTEREVVALRARGR